MSKLATKRRAAVDLEQAWKEEWEAIEKSESLKDLFFDTFKVEWENAFEQETTFESAFRLAFTQALKETIEAARRL